jgi:hypothetical protein
MMEMVINVGKVVGAFAPVDGILALGYVIFDPVKSHVHDFGSLMFDGVVGNARGACIVGLNWCCLLGVAHFVEGDLCSGTVSRPLWKRAPVLASVAEDRTKVMMEL